MRQSRRSSREPRKGWKLHTVNRGAQLKEEFTVNEKSQPFTGFFFFFHFFDFQMKGLTEMETSTFKCVFMELEVQTPWMAQPPPKCMRSQSGNIHQSGCLRSLQKRPPISRRIKRKCSALVNKNKSLGRHLLIIESL